MSDPSESILSEPGSGRPLPTRARSREARLPFSPARPCRPERKETRGEGRADDPCAIMASNGRMTPTTNPPMGNFHFIAPSGRMRRTTKYGDAVTIGRDGTTRINRACVERHGIGACEGVLPLYSRSRRVLALKIYRRHDPQRRKAVKKLAKRDGGRVARLKSLYVDLGVDVGEWAGTYAVEKRVDVKHKEVLILARRLK